jgi:hypothetical protein
MDEEHDNDWVCDACLDALTTPDIRLHTRWWNGKADGSHCILAAVELDEDGEFVDGVVVGIPVHEEGNTIIAATAAFLGAMRHPISPTLGMVFYGASDDLMLELWEAGKEKAAAFLAGEASAEWKEQHFWEGRDRTLFLYPDDVAAVRATRREQFDG